MKSLLNWLKGRMRGPKEDQGPPDLASIEHFVFELENRLTLVEKKAEATRRKVYRDVPLEEERVPENGGPPVAPPSLAGLRAGDPVPPGLF